MFAIICDRLISSCSPIICELAKILYHEKNSSTSLELFGSASSTAAGFGFGGFAIGGRFLSIVMVHEENSSTSTAMFISASSAEAGFAALMIGCRFLTIVMDQEENSSNSPALFGSASSTEAGFGFAAFMIGGRYLRWIMTKTFQPVQHCLDRHPALKVLVLLP